MSNLNLFITCVAIWGSTWLAIKFQLGVVAPEVSVFYRFLLASVLLFAYCSRSSACSACGFSSAPP